MTKIDRLASALEEFEVGDDNKFNMWKKEIQGVIKELEAANEAAEKSRASFHKIQTAKPDVIDESLKVSAEYAPGGGEMAEEDKKMQDPMQMQVGQRIVVVK